MDGCSFLPKPDLEAGLTRDYDAGGDVPQAKAYTEHRAAIDLAFSLENDIYNGERYLQLSVADFRAPES